MALTLNNEIKGNLKQLGFELHDHPDAHITSLIPQLGYQSYGYGTTYDDKTEGVLIGLDDNHNQYNNGVYLLHLLKDGKLVMEVIVPNTKDKGDLIQRVVDDVSIHIDGLDFFNLEVFDQAEIWGYVMANTVVKPLAKTLYPDDKVKQNRFITLYMPRFLSNVAHMYAGDDTLLEEGVNSEPFILKMMIDQHTDDEQPNVAHGKKHPKKDDHSESETKQGDTDSKPDKKSE